MSADGGATAEDLAAFLLTLRSGAHQRAAAAGGGGGGAAAAVPAGGIGNAYENRSAPIDCGETMHGALAAVRLVAALDVQPAHRMLEIGTGSGYVTALLAGSARMSAPSTAIVGWSSGAGGGFEDIGITNISLFLEDGRDGFAGGAPFDRVIVHAAFPAVPRQFLDQLGPNAAMICALGPGDGEQELLRLRKVGSRFEREALGPVHYQPLAFGRADVSSRVRKLPARLKPFAEKWRFTRDLTVQ